jgi:uncharacterized protein YcaQ
MATVHQLSRQDARRVAVRAQMLTSQRPPDLLTAVRRLTMLQLDPVSAVAPSADLVAWSRLGAAYQPDDLKAAIASQSIIELRAFLRPAEDFALYRADMAAWPGGGELRDWQVLIRDWVAANDRCRRDILARLAADGPAEAYRERNRRRLTALGIARAAGPEVPVEPAVVGEAGEPAEIEGVKGGWRVDPAYLDGNAGGEFAGRAALLSPFDRLVHDRVRALEIFGYEYQLEMYKPVAKRRWGYYALPVLYGDRLVGKLDATADRTAGVLTVNAVHQDIPFTKEMAAAIDEEIAGLAAWLGLEIRGPR